MKRLHLLSLLLVMLFAIPLSSCNDDDDISPRTALLTAGVWQGEGIYVQGISLIPFLRTVGENDLADQLELISSAEFKFDKDGTFTATANGAADTGTWKFTDNEQKLVITDSDNEETTFSIKNLTETDLVLELNVADLGLDPIELQGFTINTLELRFKRM